MKVAFHINYSTVWGQTLHLTGSADTLGNWDPEHAINLQYISDSLWSANIEIPDNTNIIEYKYFLRSNGKEIFEEWPGNHRIIFTPGHTHVLYDTWMNKPEHSAFYSSAFTEVIFARDEQQEKQAIPASKKICLKVFAPRTEKTQQVAITGNQAILGNWNPSKALKMSCAHFPEWEVEFDADSLSYPIEYKLIVYNNDRSDVYWESGYNRNLSFPPLKENETVVVSGLSLRENLPAWKCAGTVIPVFALRSKDSFGIGDFGDLKKMTDWAQLTGQRIIQILPVNDTTMNHSWIDSYPYNAISIYALHPLYLNLQRMGTLEDKPLARKISQAQKKLNSLEKVDYEEVDHYKWLFFRAIFAQEGIKTLKSKGFKQFFTQNKDWLLPYAAYSYLRDLYKTSDFRHWPEYSTYQPKKIASLCDPKAPQYSEIAIYFYLQYHLHIQLSEAKAYAKKYGVVLKGDIPIGISDTSIEAWTEPRYFNMNVQAGAPPDDFSASGQNWGFPTYNWDEMKKDGYAWWKKRFRHMAHYFDAYRIDHILGFFRIWEVPKNSIQALLATFNPSLPLSLKEICSAGFRFNKEHYTQARINGVFLSELLGVYTQEATEKYLIRLSPKYFALHPDFDTQVKIRDYFREQDDFKSQTIKNALYSIANEVLFIPDTHQPDLYHPRIAAGQTFAYRELVESDKHAFDYLYWDYFYHRQNKFWKEQAYNKLIPLISSTNMLVCGEDLGMIPQCVPEVMDQLQILSLEIERMPKQMHVEFERLKEIPYHSVCTTSTHDMSTIRGWWEENPEKTQRYYNDILQRSGTAPTSCPTEICSQIIRNHLDSPAMLVIIPLQDWISIHEKIRRENPEEERINIPSNPRHYWGYRMHTDIEDLLKEKELNTSIRKMLEESLRL